MVRHRLRPLPVSLLFSARVDELLTVCRASAVASRSLVMPSEVLEESRPQARLRQNLAWPITCGDAASSPTRARREPPTAAQQVCGAQSKCRVLSRRRRPSRRGHIATGTLSSPFAARLQLSFQVDREMDAKPFPVHDLQLPTSPETASKKPASEPTALKPYAASLISLALSHDILLFGSFTLKSGRVSPYFYNAGLFHSGFLLTAIGSAFAAAINDAGLEFDVLFGPAYKGIPLAAVTTVELTRLDPAKYGELGYTYNRKEKKDHGEGGTLVGAPLKGKRVLILDDVITAGTAIREAVSIIQEAEGKLVGAAVNLDRQEKGKGDLSAIQEVERDYGVPVVSVITMSDIIAYIRVKGSMGNELAGMEEYRSKWGIKEVQ